MDVLIPARWLQQESTLLVGEKRGWWRRTKVSGSAHPMGGPKPSLVRSVAVSGLTSKPSGFLLRDGAFQRPEGCTFSSWRS